MNASGYDFIVVGAGSAGCVLARRLAETGAPVLLLEAGTAARNPMLHIPLGFAFLLKPHKNNWAYKTQAELFLNRRRVDLPRGKVLGGCSAINGMVYVRGQREDYDHWAALGNKGWSYQELLPFFDRSTDRLWVGDLTQGKIKQEFPICEAFIEAAVQAGYSRNDNINGASQTGAGYFPHNIKNGKRWSSASAFLNDKPATLTVMTEANVRRVHIEHKKAIGVECDIKGALKTFYANREVILCGGAINSPKILEHSGIGKAGLLRQLGIPVVMDLPGVGENLHDHWNAYMKCSVSHCATYFSEAKPLRMLQNLFRYLLFKESFLANPAALVAVFYNALGDSARPDAQIHFAPAASNIDGKGNMVPIEGVTIASCGLRPTSRGHTHITSTDVKEAPAIQVNYLQTEQDRKVAIAAFRKAREIFRQQAMKPFGGRELEPGMKVESDTEILDYICRSGDPVHHLAGSCKMGNDAMAVVDNQLRVHGVTGLRVADASIMPEIVSGNTHAACVMIGERVADFCLNS